MQLERHFAVVGHQALKPGPSAVSVACRL